jgi:ribosomal-protein-alanine N-acetyltransferase
MFELQRVRADHEAAILDFELLNRSYFTASINDRGDKYFREFSDEHRDLLAAQDSGSIACYVLLDEDQTIVGRFNLYDIVDGTAEVGYRLAHRVAGRGVATATLENFCRIAHDEYGVAKLTAATPLDNVASQRVLRKAGFVSTGPTEVAGQPGISFELFLADD